MTTTPIVPSLAHVFTIEASIDPPRSAGNSPFGERLHIPITGGSVTGPRLSGIVLPGGSDWPLIGPDGHSRINAHYTIQADDGALIYVQNRGIRVSPTAVMARLRAGEIVDPSEYYFRTVPEFDVPDGPNQWLRERIFVASLAPHGKAINIQIYQVL